jgi:hypothetical protein
MLLPRADRQDRVSNVALQDLNAMREAFFGWAPMPETAMIMRTLKAPLSEETVLE